MRLLSFFLLCQSPKKSHTGSWHKWTHCASCTGGLKNRMLNVFGRILLVRGQYQCTSDGLNDSEKQKNNILTATKEMSFFFSKSLTCSTSDNSIERLTARLQNRKQNSFWMLLEAKRATGRNTKSGLSDCVHEECRCHDMNNFTRSLQVNQAANKSCKQRQMNNLAYTSHGMSELAREHFLLLLNCSSRYYWSYKSNLSHIWRQFHLIFWGR